MKRFKAFVSKQPDKVAIILSVIFVLIYLSTFEHSYYAGVYSRYAYDEYRNMVVAKGFAETGIPTLLSCDFILHPPVLFALGTIFGPEGVFNATIVVTLCLSFIGLLFTYIIAKRFFNSRVALLSLIVLGLSRVYWLYSNRFLHLVLESTLSLIVIFFLLRKGIKNSILAGFFSGIMILTKGTSMVFWGCVIIYMILRYMKRPKMMIKQIVLISVITWAVYAPYALYLSVNGFPWNPIELNKEVAIAGSREFIDYGPPYYYFTHIFETGQEEGILHLAYLPLLLLGVYFLAKDRFRKGRLVIYKEYDILLIWAIVFMVGFGLLVVDKEVKYVASIIPALCMIIALGFETIGRRNALRYALVIIPLVFSIYSSLAVALYDGVYLQRSPVFDMLDGLNTTGTVMSILWPPVIVLTDQNTEFLYNNTSVDFMNLLVFDSHYILIDRYYPYIGMPAFRTVFEDNSTGFNFELIEVNLSMIESYLGLPEPVWIAVIYNGEPVEDAVIHYYYGNISMQTKTNKFGMARAYLLDGANLVDIRATRFNRRVQYLYIENDTIFFCNQEFTMCYPGALSFELEPLTEPLKHTVLCARY